MKTIVRSLCILSCLPNFACVGKLDVGDLPGDSEGETEESDTLPADGTDTNPSDTDPADTDPSDTDVPDPSEVDKLDVLFIVDDSGSMGTAQRQLQDSAATLASALDESGLDYRIAVTNTDNGNYWCQGAGISQPEFGNFVLSSCRQRIDEFYFSGNDTDVSEQACLERCSLETIPTLPVDGTMHPWLSNQALGDGVSMADALACALPMGISGCGFEQPLESMRQALLHSGNPTDDESGFIRPDAHLAVIIVTDEADCSGDSEEIFHEEGLRTFWSDPDNQQSPTSAVCWNAGVTCTGDPSGYDDCFDADKDADGSPAPTPADAVLHPVSRYENILAAVQADKLSFGAQVFVFGFTGVPVGYQPGETIPYARPDGSAPDSFEALFGVSPGCVHPTAGEAVPPVRLRDFTNDTNSTGRSRLYSICESDYGFAFADLVARISP